MERIELTSKSKAILNKIIKGEYPDSVPTEDLPEIVFLEQSKLIQSVHNEFGVIYLPRLTEYGDAYVTWNPKLKNPSLWQDKKYMINTALSIIALVISIIALIKKQI